MIPIITILGHFSEGWSQKYPCEVGKCYYPHFYTGNWGTDGSKSQKAYLAEQSLETGSQSLLLLCRGSATGSSHSSLHLWSISTHIYFTDMKPSLGSIARSLCSAAAFHECCLPPHRWSTVGLTGCLTAWRVAPPPLRCAPTTAPAHTSNTNLRFPSGCRRYNCFLPPMPWGRLWSQGHSSLCFGSQYLLSLFDCVSPIVYYQHSGHAFLFLQGFALPHSKITGNLLSHATDFLLLWKQQLSFGTEASFKEK